MPTVKSGPPFPRAGGGTFGRSAGARPRLARIRRTTTRFSATYSPAHRHDRGPDRRDRGRRDRVRSVDATYGDGMPTVVHESSDLRPARGAGHRGPSSDILLAMAGRGPTGLPDSRAVPRLAFRALRSPPREELVRVARPVP